MNKQNELITSNGQSALSTFNLLDEKQITSAEIFLKKIMSSDKGGIKSVNEGLAILMRAQDLQLPFSTCIEHIHVINGKTGVDIHIVKALLLRAGVTWKCTKDYAPQYKYTDGSNIYDDNSLPDYVVRCRTYKEAEAKTTEDIVGIYPLRYYQDLKGNVYTEMQISDKCVKALNAVQAINIAKEGKFPVIRIQAVPSDYITEYLFTRYIPVNGEMKEMTAKSRFSYTDATIADLFTKDTYKKYARTLIGHRAFTLGARDIASDILFGVMEAGELKIINNVELDSEDYTEVEVEQ